MNNEHGAAGLIKNISLYSFLFIFVSVIPSLGFASVAGEVNKANNLYMQGKLDDSLDLYQKALDQQQDSPVVKYDLGTAYYKKGEYKKALDYLGQAARDKNIKIKPKAEYNLGNALYKSGLQKENTNVDEAIKSLQEAVGHYGQVLSIDPKDQDAAFNRDFVKREIERLRQKKQQQQQQQQQNQNNKDQKQQQNNQQGQQQNQQQNQQQQSQQQKNQNQQDQQKQQNQQSQQDQQKKQEGQQNQQGKQDQRKAQAQVEQSLKDLERKQAEDQLEDYRENEEPKKLLNYMPQKIDDRPVLKDW